MQIWSEINYFRENLPAPPNLWPISVERAWNKSLGKEQTCKNVLYVERFLWLKIQESEKKKEIPFTLIVKWIESIWIEIIEIPIRLRPQYDEFATF